MRFYAMCAEHSSEQKNEVNRYKYKMKQLLGRKSDAGWAEGIKSEWFWG